MSFDRNFKLLRLVEDIVEILGIQLGPKKGISVHYSKLVNALKYNTRESEAHFPVSRDRGA
jgi:hypothetical protein